MLQLFIGWRLETVDLTSLRIYARHHVLDRTVFSGGIRGLEDDKQGVSVVSVKDIVGWPTVQHSA